MALKDLQRHMEYCCRCNLCKWIPMLEVRSVRFAYGCPSIARYNFHAYSGGGRGVVAFSLLLGRSDYTDEALDVIYRCQLCGACDVMCHESMELVEPLDTMRELRIKCVEDGQLLPAHMAVIEGLRKEDNMMQKPKADRGKWADGLEVKDLTKEKAEVAFHAGCQLSFDEEQWPVARAGITLLKKAGVDVGIMGAAEACCGGRAYEMGYSAELTKFAEHTTEMLKTAGVKTLVTPCSDGYSTFKSLYPMIGIETGVEVLHITEYLDRLIKDGKIKPTKRVPLHVTYHDPCHLGRLGEPYVPWNGEWKKGASQIIYTEPQKPIRHGVDGVYEPPRDILRSIPGLELSEMERSRHYSWCCGAGGGVKEAYPDFAMWTATERIEEAKATGAEALVTACPWCERNFRDALQESGDRFRVYDVVELLQEAL